MVIAGLLPNPSGQESLNEAVFLKNVGNTPVNLNGWTIRDRANSFWALGDRAGTSGATVAPGETIQIRRLLQPMALNNSGDTVRLIAPDGRVVDEVSYGRTRQDEFFSFGC
ncbi:MAG: lamin tail domain-containing protein [Cyanobacteria bacterium J06639_1]